MYGVYVVFGDFLWCTYSEFEFFGQIQKDYYGIHVEWMLFNYVIQPCRIFPIEIKSFDILPYSLTELMIAFQSIHNPSSVTSKCFTVDERKREQEKRNKTK